MVVVEMGYAHLVPAFETASVGFAVALRDMGMLVLVTIVHVWATLFVVVFTGAFYTVVEAVAHDVVEFRRWGIPIPGLSIPCRYRSRW
jgi:hypothetical protein